MRALQKHPTDRWPSMRAFAAATSGGAAIETPTEPRPRRRGFVLAASAVIAITATVAVWLSVSGQDQQPPRGAGGGGVFEGDGEMKRFGIGAAMVAAMTVGSAHAGEPVQWAESDGGNGHWYSTVVSSDMSNMYCWTEARDNASQRGGHLVTITSAAENAFIQTNLPSVTAPDGSYTWAWLGAYQDSDDQEPGEFSWVTGEPWDWTNWSPGNPSNDGGFEDYVITDGTGYGVWNDLYNCWTGHHLYAYLIEFEADCNGDGIVDYGQILDGTYEDADGNGVPDCCDDDSCDPGCPADIFEDGAVTIEDLLILLAQYGTPGPEADIDGNGIVNIEDLLMVVGSWGDCP
jgi:hypothetical protein